MMVQTNMALSLSHGRGTKHRSPIHHLSSNYNVLSCPLGPQQPNLPSVHHLPAKSPPDAPSSAEIFRPKSQYHCHWFKQRMKRKKRKRFRKPKPLFHLTWKYKAVTLTLCALVTAYKVGCRVERFVSSSLSGGFCWVLSLFSKTSTHSISYDSTPCQGSLKAWFVVFQSLVFPNASKACFDTDSFKI
jgi:hypothetical protein